MGMAIRLSGAATRRVTIPAKSTHNETFLVDGSAFLRVGEFSAFGIQVKDGAGDMIDRLAISLGLVPEKPRLNISRIGHVQNEQPVNRQRWRSLAGFTADRYVRIGTDEKRFAPDDLRVRGHFAWSDAGFVFFYEVTDDSHVTVEGWDAWTGDSMQMAFTSLRSQERHKEPADFELLLARQKDGAKIFFRKDGKPVKSEQLSMDTFVNVERDDTERKTYYQGQIAWTDLSTLTVAPDARFAFTFLVNDNDGNGRKGWIEMTSGIGGHKGTYGFAEITLKEL